MEDGEYCCDMGKAMDEYNVRFESVLKDEGLDGTELSIFDEFRISEKVRVGNWGKVPLFRALAHKMRKLNTSIKDGTDYDELRGGYAGVLEVMKRNGLTMKDWDSWADSGGLEEIGLECDE